MITIFIHGTLFFLLKFPFINNYFFCPPGIMPITHMSEKYHIRNLMETLSCQDSKKFNMQDCYSFGWSGTLSDAARSCASEDLYGSIVRLVKDYEKSYQKKPFIRLITHSHGGNVALKLAQQYKKDNAYFSIDELILLACPVQVNTAHLVADQCFKKVYSLYSYADFIQVLDPQGLGHFWQNKKRDTGKKGVRSSVPLFSLRHFDKAPQVVQAYVKINNKNLIHMDFLRINFFKQLPVIIDMLEKNAKNPYLDLHKNGFIVTL